MNRFAPLLAVAALAFAGCKKNESAKPAAQTTDPQRDVPTARRTPPSRDVPAAPDRKLTGRDRGPGDYDGHNFGGRMGPRIEEFDKDGDGKLSDDEREAMKADRDQRRADRQAEREAMKAEFDKDGDGKLSDDERATMRDTRITDMMIQLDADGDDRITQAELGDAAGGRMQRLFDNGADTDGDGALSRAELEVTMKQRPPNLDGRDGSGGSGWGGRRGGPKGDPSGTGTPPATP